MPPEQPTLSIIIVNWNTADLLAACLRSIERHVQLPYEIIVIDNHSGDRSVEVVRQEFPGCRLLVQDQNLGFAQSNNVGLALANGRYLLLLNPDTEIRPGGLQALVTFMEANPLVGIAGPTLWNHDGSLQPSSGPLPTLWEQFLRQTMLYRYFPTGPQRLALHDVTRRVGWVTGAALCIRRSCYEEIGPLDAAIFMFYEDTDWCKRAADMGWEVWFVSDPGVMHWKAAASKQFARTRTLLDSQRSTIYYFQKHVGFRAIRLLRLITLSGALARSLRAIVNWCIGSDRPDQAARLRAYWQMLRWAVTGGGL